MPSGSIGVLETDDRSVTIFAPGAAPATGSGGLSSAAHPATVSAVLPMEAALEESAKAAKLEVEAEGFVLSKNSPTASSVMDGANGRNISRCLMRRFRISFISGRRI